MQNRFRALGIACAVLLSAFGIRALHTRAAPIGPTTAGNAREDENRAAARARTLGTPASTGAVAGASMQSAESGTMARMEGVPRAPVALVQAPVTDGLALSGTNTAAAGTDPAGAMLLRQGQASLEVKHVDDAVARVRQTSAQFGGFVANATVRGGRDETRSASLEVRVPSARFDALVAALGSLGRVESVTASAQDAGDEYVDLAARAANARHFEARLTEMLATRTGKLSDILAMEQELARVREQIERYEGRIKYLERRASLSTLTIALHEPLPLVERPDAGPIAEAFASAWERALGVLAWCIAALGLLVPGAILVGGVVLVVRRATRKPELPAPAAEVPA